MDTTLATLSAQVGDLLRGRGWLLATAESCTGGWVAEVVTATAGSSAWFDCGFVTYSNEAKQALLGVTDVTLHRHGAVSEATVAAMVAGALGRSQANLAVATSGIAGPGGGTDSKPVGTVCFAWGLRGGATDTATRLFSGNRESVRRQAVAHALQGLLERYQEAPPADASHAKSVP
ncbi:MAG: nicotinamide-nucleotide amidohydrolase family protein [Zoogloeaceae bacterium]|nr:nicotinamide-nucleotide amidohydrolase family protein [Zoogloeaceae bacterium]